MDNAMAMPGTAPAGAPELAYARFLPRFRAGMIDAIIMVVAVFAAIFLAALTRSDTLARPLGFTVGALWLLYEPLFVAFAGGTLGHRYANLRVIDDRTGGNLGFLRAFVRSILKGALGWVSFVTMLTTRRSQAVHDLLTRSTVQIRDLSKAGSGQFVRERLELASPLMPSGMRRALTIVVYELVFIAIICVATIMMAEAGAISDACYTADRCNRTDDLFFTIAGGVLVAGCVVILVLGWRGLLWGARRRKPDMTG